jgi:hypothetical protein
LDELISQYKRVVYAENPLDEDDDLVRADAADVREAAERLPVCERIALVGALLELNTVEVLSR